MADEIELKLELDADAAAVLAASDLVPGAGSRATLHALYFDTADHRLAKAGLSLRIRRSGRKRIQTVKADGGHAAGLFARREWERPVRNDTPVVDDATPIPALLGADVAAVAPIFRVEVTRTTWNLVDGDAQIELVLDQGAVIVGDARALVSEIELELKTGDPAALFRCARRIAERVPVRLGVLSKSERGYRLAGPDVSAVKAVPVTLSPAVTTGEAFQQIALACVRQYRLNETLLLETGGAEALHQARVALRRLRSAIRIFGAVVRDARGQAIGDELRWLTAELGAVRDLDVLLMRAKPGPLQARLLAARAEAQAHIFAVLGSGRVRGLLFGLAEWIAEGDWLRAADSEGLRDGPVRDHAIAALDRYRRKVKRGGRDLAAVDDETRHALRKEAKALRYTSEFFGSLFDGKRAVRRHKRFIAALEALQDRLGVLNDRAAAPAVLAALGLSDDAEANALLAQGKGKAMRRKAAEAWDDWADTKRFWR